MAPDRRIHLREVLGGLERGAARRAVDSDSHDLAHPLLPGGLDELSVGRLAQLEMRVVVDHARLGNSGSSGATLPPGAPSAARSFALVRGMYGSSSVLTVRSPS